jgi:hypothetical protein
VNSQPTIDASVSPIGLANSCCRAAKPDRYPTVDAAVTWLTKSRAGFRVLNQPDFPYRLALLVAKPLVIRRECTGAAWTLNLKIQFACADGFRTDLNSRDLLF